MKYRALIESDNTYLSCGTVRLFSKWFPSWKMADRWLTENIDRERGYGAEVEGEIEALDDKDV